MDMKKELMDLPSTYSEDVYFLQKEIKENLQMIGGDEVNVSYPFKSSPNFKLKGFDYVDGDGHGIRYFDPAFQWMKRHGALSEYQKNAGWINDLTLYVTVKVNPKMFRSLCSEIETIRKERRLSPIEGPLVPPDARPRYWKDLEIELVSDTEIRSRFEKNAWRRDSMSGMKLNHGRKGDRPGIVWTLLIFFAEKDGRISWSTPGITTLKQSKNLQNSVQRLSEALRRIFGIKTSPFSPYRKQKAYESLFRIRDCRPNSEAAIE